MTTIKAYDNKSIASTDPSEIAGDNLYRVEMYVLIQEGDAKSWYNEEYIYVAADIVQSDDVEKLAIAAMEASLLLEKVDHVAVGVYHWNDDELFDKEEQ